MANETKVITGKARLSYANVWRPKSTNGSAEKYSCVLLIPKTDKDTIAKVNEAIKEAEKAGTAKFGAKFVGGPNFKRQFHDGDEKGDENYENCYYINANNTEKPGILGKNKEPITDQTEVYSGCYARASINFFPYNTNGNKGIGCSLNGLQKMADGESLGGRSRAEDDFDVIADDDDFLS